jgi:hypothetical protein
MSGLYNAIIAAYPLYQTSKCLEENEKQSQALLRWLYFWMTFSSFKVLESLGASDIPFFTTLEAMMLLTMYSEQHATVISNMIPRLCAGYMRMANNTIKFVRDAAVNPTTTTGPSNAEGDQAESENGDEWRKTIRNALLRLLSF